MSDSLNSVTLSGNLGRDAEVRYTSNGTAVVSFVLAVNKSQKQTDGSFKDYTSWIDCTMFGKRGEAMQASGYLQKGARLAIVGHLKQNSWEKDGTVHRKLDVIVDNVVSMTNYRAPQEQAQQTYQQPYQQAYQPAQQQAAYVPDVYDEDVPF